MHAAVICFASAIAQLGLTVAILVLVRYQLQGMSPVAVDGKLTLAETCYLSLPDNWPGACVYADVAACVSLAFTVAYVVLQLCATMRTSSSTSSNRVPKRLHAAQVLVLLFGTVWWLAAACTLQYFTVRANQAGLAHAPQRAALLACCWGSLGLFVLLATGKLLPTAVALITAPAVCPLQQQCWPRPHELQLGLPVHQASSSSSSAAAAAGRGYMPTPTSFSAPTGASLYGRQQQQSIVMGIPCAAAAPAGSAHSMPQLPLPGAGPGAVQAALLMRGNSFASGGRQAVRLPSLQPPAPAALGTAAGSRTLSDIQGVAGRVIVVNRSV